MCRRGQQQPWQPGEVGTMQSVSSELGGSANPCGGLSAAAGAGAVSPAALLGAPMWSQQWSAPGVGQWGPTGGVPVVSTVPGAAAIDNAIFSNGTGSILSGATLLGKALLVRSD